MLPTYDGRMARDPSRHPQAVRITTAPASRADDISARQRRYVLSMGVRTLCFVGAIVVGDGWVRWVLVAAALILPYVAVVMANASNSKPDGFELIGGGSGHAELPAAPDHPDTPDTPGQGRV